MSKLNKNSFLNGGENQMKTIITSVAAAAAITVAGVASAQDLTSGGGMSPYVGIEHTTTPTTAGVGGATADTWWGGESETEITVGATADLPWDLAMDGSVGFVNATDATATPADTSSWDMGGFALGGASVTVSYEMANGIEIYSTTEFDAAFDRTSTSVGATWSF